MPFYFSDNLYYATAYTRMHVGTNGRTLLAFIAIAVKISRHIAGAPNENIVQNHLNIALLNVF